MGAVASAMNAAADAELGDAKKKNNAVFKALETKLEVMLLEIANTRGAAEVVKKNEVAGGRTAMRVSEIRSSQKAEVDQEIMDGIGDFLSIATGADPAQAAVEDMQLRADEQRFSELQPRSYGEAQQLQAVRQKIQRLRIEALGAVHADPELFGADGAWLALRGQCFDSLPVSEKSVLGGTSNVVARFYVFRLCPFRNVTQREADHFEWKKATARAEGKKLKRSSPPAPTVLGEFQVWADTNDARHPLYFSQRQLVVSEASARGARQVYEGGEPCAGDRQRVVIVRPMCASTTRLVRVDEDGVCNYLMDLETPAACRGVGVSRVRDLERRLAYPRVYATARSAMSFGARLWRRSMILLLRVTGRRPVGAWVLRVEAGLAYGRARAALYLGS